VLVQEFTESTGRTPSDAAGEITRSTHKAIKKVTKDMESLSFNTAVAAQMEFVNELYKLKEQDAYANGKEWQFALESLVQLMAPFAPHISEELWQQLGRNESVHITEWPKYDETYLVEDTVTIAVQVNGKLRGTVSAPNGSDQAAVEALAQADPKVVAHTEGHEVLKTIFVPNKLLNFVVKN
jgi:leucyl-tRNA synthetase